MDANHQDTASNQIATENKIWLPPSFTNNKAPIIPAPKKKGINWGFANRSVFDWTILVSQVLGAIGIPFVVTILGLYLTQQVTQQQTQANDRQHQTDLQIASDQQQETTLQTYLDRMSDLLLNQNLRNSKQGDEVRIVARSRTLTVLSQLSAARKSTVFQFLYEAGLISGNNIIISLAKANLEGVTLQMNPLYGSFSIYRASLVGTDLAGANLEG